MCVQVYTLEEESEVNIGDWLVVIMCIYFRSEGFDKHVFSLAIVARNTHSSSIQVYLWSCHTLGVAVIITIQC